MNPTRPMAVRAAITAPVMNKLAINNAKEAAAGYERHFASDPGETTLDAFEYLGAIHILRKTRRS